MYYCHVLNQQIIAGPRPLPSNISPENALNENWYPAIFLNLPHHLECNSLTQLIEMRMQLINEAVQCWHEVVSKSETQLQDSITLMMNIVREERDKKLLHCDWTQLPNAPLTEENKILWETYRQALRDFPSVVDLSNIVWPSPPTM